ncbi:MAG: ATP-binding cassette domain-containing protein [Lachnospiraceae bacterium]|nr:ATP-binding cassette domain-containing protein [Lachnospiraceae bacterium]
MDNNILLVGPWQVGKAFLENITRPDFLKIVIYSLGRIGLGFFLALLCGLLLGALSYCYTVLEEILAPVMVTLKSIPVASFVVLLLIWFGSARLSFFISFLIVFPNVYVNTIAGLKSTDKQLLEMADVFEIKGWNRFCYIYRPALMPYLTSCLKISLGMSWKSGVAAEVIGMPEFSLGERLYMSKIYLDTAGLFAWTLSIVLLSFFFEKAVLYLVEKFTEWKPYPISKNRNIKSAGKGSRTQDDAANMTNAANAKKETAIRICNVDKSYGEKKVLENFSITLEKGGRYCLMAPSGSGKTTLLRLLNQIEKADNGSIEGLAGRVGMVFQEDRLCEEYDVIKNVMLTRSAQQGTTGMARQGTTGMVRQSVAEMVRQEAGQILPEDCLDKPVKELSGGMKRRCAILRTMLSGAEVIIMDEPFTGLDEENRRKTALYILKKLEGRTLLVTTHQEADVKLLQGIKIEL